MKYSTTDQAAGKINEVTGKAKEKLGRASNNPRLTAKGQDQKIGGKIRKKVGQIERVFNG